MVQSNQNVSTRNKGVNITSEAFPPTDDNRSEGASATEFPSLYNVRNQLQNVIDVMGPTTPQLIYSTVSADADNEDSVISSTSIFSSVLQVQHRNVNRDACQSMSTCNSPRDSPSEVETYAMVNEIPPERPGQPICMPAVLPPAVLCMNPSCVCTHSVAYLPQMPIVTVTDMQNRPKQDKTEKKSTLSTIIGRLTKNNVKENRSNQMELYKMNIKQPKNNASLPRRFVFDLVEGVPKPEVNTVGTNTKSCNQMCPNVLRKKTPTRKSHKRISTHSSRYSAMAFSHTASEENCKKMQHATYYKNMEENSRMAAGSEKHTARVDVYYFDHGNASYFKTTDCPPIILTEILAEKAENLATKFWAELFGTVYIGFAFFTSFILQFFRFLLHSIIRPLTVGLLQLLSDYFFKPLLAVLFNAIIQPPLTFLYNIATSLRDLCDPLAEGLGYFIREIAVICKSIRLFEIKQAKKKHDSTEKCCKNLET